MSTTAIAHGRGLLRLVLASPDGRRVLARPNGLAGWSLPAVPATLPVGAWTPEVAARAERLVGSALEPVRPLPPDAWVVSATGRITAIGNTWIRIDEAARLGPDETIVVRWSETDAAERAGPPAG